ncbi:MAG: transposase [Candidatus Acidiferrum sp.]
MAEAWVPHPLVCKGAGVAVQRHPLRRYYGRGDLHFITFSCYRRRAFLGRARTRDCFVGILDQVRRRYQFRLFGYVVMPEHVHLLISEPGKGTPSSVVQALKQTVSRVLRRNSKKKGGAQLAFPWETDETEANAFWQRRFYDFNVWSSRKVLEKLEYMHDNPVKRKLVVHPRDWPWSSWSHYAKPGSGLIRMDSLAEVEEKNPHP